MDAHPNFPSFIVPDPSAYHPVNEPLLVEWESPSNIALVKYWGKKGLQLPMNPSVSFTLSNCVTRTSVELLPLHSGSSWVELRVDGKHEPVFEQRMSNYLESLQVVFPFLRDANIRIQTSNSFPHSAGIASSASAMSAMALCLSSLDEMLRKSPSQAASLRGISCIARLGSGSASRSVYPYLAIWGFHHAVPESSDLYAIPIEQVHPMFLSFRDAILIVDASRKPISSSVGHQLMEKHPYAAARTVQARENLLILLDAMKKGELDTFIRIVELEALSLHGLMMSSTPSYTLLKEGTLSIMHEIRKYREQTGVPLCFTLDAGPNIHLLYPVNEAKRVEILIQEVLKQYCFEKQVIFDRMGTGPQRIR